MKCRWWHSKGSFKLVDIVTSYTGNKVMISSRKCKSCGTVEVKRSVVNEVRSQDERVFLIGGC